MMISRSVYPRAISLINADLGRTGVSSLRVAGSIIHSIGENPASGDLIVDLRGDRLLPGLINAHDHLQLNGFRRLKYRDRYTNVRAWIDDISLRRSTDAELVACQAVPLRTRQVHGGLKNIVSGVTTVAHHDPVHQGLFDRDFPIRVVEKIGWSHSLQIDGALCVQHAYRATPTEWPWVIHAAEGIDAEAAQEFAKLDELGCISENTLIVHGMGLGETQQKRLMSAGGGLIWCPSSNIHLFGTTLNVTRLASLHRIALGTDSRMSGERDLLSELAAARKACELDGLALESMVTGDAARLLRLKDRGILSAGALADLLILPAGRALHETNRSDIRLVMLNGEIRLGDSHYVPMQARATQWVEIELDGQPKLMDRGLATLLTKLAVHEPGLEMRSASWRAA
jgi:cytosine/adenosine deaminase-related metal-dependent hydrolase